MIPVIVNHFVQLTCIMEWKFVSVCQRVLPAPVSCEASLRLIFFKFCIFMIRTDLCLNMRVRRSNLIWVILYGGLLTSFCSFRCSMKTQFLESQVLLNSAFTVK